MMWIHMERPCNFVPPEGPRITVKYLAGRRYPVKRAWGQWMVDAGYAREVRAPRRGEAAPAPAASTGAAEAVEGVAGADCAGGL